MLLLVSVTNAAEASAAIAGGADIVDAKDPGAGALGAVSRDAMRAIHAVAGERPTTAALGEAASERAVERDADTFVRLGARLVKVGFAGITAPERVESLLVAAMRGAGAVSHRAGGVIAVAYADADRVGSAPPPVVMAAAARAGASGVLLDTADKGGPSLAALVSPDALTRWVAEGHAAGLLVAVAGKVSDADVDWLRATGADVMGVRGSACEGGRMGLISTSRVRVLRALCAADRRHVLLPA